MAKEHVFNGSDVAGAIKEACAKLKVTQDKLNIEIIRTGTSGIFGLIRRKAQIKVSLKAAEEPAEQAGQLAEVAPAPEVSEDRAAAPKARPAKERPAAKPRAPREKTPRPESEPAAPITPELFAEVEKEVGQILQLMGFPSEVRASQDENKVIVRIDGEYEDNIIGTDGQTLDALQYLLRKMISRKFPGRVMIALDAGKFREGRRQELMDLAAQMAAEVKETGKTRTLPALNPAERRIVHMHLQQDNTIRSRSVGEGIFKKVLIYLPTKGKKRGGRPRRRSEAPAAVQE